MFNWLESTTALLILSAGILIFGMILLLSPELMPNWILRLMGLGLVVDAIGFAMIALRKKAWDEYDKHTNGGI